MRFAWLRRLVDLGQHLADRIRLPGLAEQPLDREAILASARKTGKVLIAHEGTAACGVGAEVAALIGAEAFEDLDAPIRRLTAPDVPIPFSPPLEGAVLPQLDDMKEACRELLAY